MKSIKENLPRNERRKKRENERRKKKRIIFGKLT